MLMVSIDLLSVIKDIPYSTLFILGLAALISVLTTLVNRRFSNPEKSKAWRKEISDWNKELREARKKDKKTLEKVMKKQQYIMQLQSKMMWNSMKVSLIFLAPLFIMWQVLGGFYHDVSSIAYLPGVGSTIPLPSILAGFGSPLIWWYLVCSLLVGTACQHLFGLIEVNE